MKLVTLDFETYYDSKIKLGFKHQTTEEYIRDSRFEVIGVGIQVDDGEPVWYAGSHDEVGSFLATYELDKAAVLCHNMLFDGAVLSWIFGIKPAQLLDTLCMARAIHGVNAGGSLQALAQRYELGQKGDEVIHAEGKRRADFTLAQLNAYGEYCKNDVALTFSLFQQLAEKFNDNELELIDMTLRMFTEPKLEVDDALLQQRLEELRQEKSELLRGLMGALECDSEEEVRKRLASNPKFADILRSKGVEPPMKVSPATGKMTYALAKNDEGFIELTEHDDPLIQQLCAVRLGTKSTLEESRIQRFMDMGMRNEGKLPIPLKYYGTHTGRWAGADKVNFQNLPSRDKRKKTLKNAVCASMGSLVINCDSSQIEARVLAWLAGQEDVVKQFAKGEDVYSIFASKIFSRTITKADPVERFVGKTCILGLGYGTGGEKLRHTLKTQPPGSDVSLEEAKRYVDLYRSENKQITKLWREADNLLEQLHIWEGNKPFWFGEHKCVRVNGLGIKLPNGLYIRYDNLRRETEDPESRFVYDSRKGPLNIWGGALVENVVQALARIIVGEQMLKIRKRYPIALTVHDSAVAVVKESEINSAEAYIVECMSTPPAWAKGLPVACELKFANSYGEC
jgi:DNA polymerase I-like protein with 3'-5' exonuclease and polymerase domains